MRISFDGYDRTATLTNFPALVVLDEDIPGFLYSQFASPPDGGDLRFTSFDGTEELPYEVEKWDDSGVSYLWVRVPELDPGRQVVAYWGNALATTPPVYTGDGSTWSENFGAVWHLNETGTSIRVDSSPNPNDGTPVDYDGDESVAGKIAGGDRLNGVDDTVIVGNHVSIQGSDQITISAWVNATAWEPVTENAIIRKSGDYRLLNWDTGYMTLKIEASPDVVIEDTMANYITGNWFYIVGTYDRFGEGANARFYRNGELVTAMYSDAPAVTSTDPLHLGSKDGSFQFYNGILDEARVSRTARSADWVRACWLNQSSSSVFAVRGPVGSAVDTDADGIRDGWEIRHFGDVRAADAASDADSDRFIDAEEFVAGTDPLDPKSLLEITDLEVVAGPAVVLSWSSETGRLYDILYTVPAGGAWSPLESGLPATQTLNVHTVETSTLPSAWFRVEVKEP